MELTKEQVMYRAEHGLKLIGAGKCVLEQSVPIKVLDCSLENESVDLQITVADNMLNSFGILHGGVTAWAADVAMAAAISCFNGEMHGSTIDMNVNYIRPISKGKVITLRAYNQCCGNFARRARVDFLVDDLLFVSAMGNYTGRKMTSRIISNPEGELWLVNEQGVQRSFTGEEEFSLMIDYLKSFGSANPIISKELEEQSLKEITQII